MLRVLLRSFAGGVPGDAAGARLRYLVAIRAADRGNYDGLTGLHLRFAEGA